MKMQLFLRENNILNKLPNLDNLSRDGAESINLMHLRHKKPSVLSEGGYFNKTESCPPSYPSTSSSKASEEDSGSSYLKRNSHLGSYGMSVISTNPSSPSRPKPYDYGSSVYKQSDYGSKIDSRVSSIPSILPCNRVDKKPEDYWNTYNPHKPREIQIYKEESFKKHSFNPTPEMNETFTSQKAKRNVSEYNRDQAVRPIHSRDKENSSFGKPNSSDFSLIGLENIGNTCYYNVILQCLFHLKDFNKIFIDGSYKKLLNKNQKTSM